MTTALDHAREVRARFFPPPSVPVARVTRQQLGIASRKKTASDVIEARQLHERIPVAKVGTAYFEEPGPMPSMVGAKGADRRLLLMVSIMFGLSMHTIVGKGNGPRRRQYVADARSYLVKRMKAMGRSNPVIGRMLERDPATICYLSHRGEE